MARSTSCRRHWRASRRGVVAAVATLFGLLLVVVLISNFIITPLPSQEAANESQHILLVENQMAAFQSAINMESKPGGVPLGLTVPIRLGAGSVPPFGASSASELELLQASATTQDAFSVTQVVPLNISWSANFPSCNNCKSLYYNISYNGSSGQTISARGQAGFAIVLNLLGSQNSGLTLDLRGNANYAYIIIAGSNNTVTLTSRGNGNCNNETAILYGQYNTLDLSQLTGCGTVNVVFITSSIPSNPSSPNAQCPANNPLLMLTNRLLYPPASDNATLFLNQTEWFETGVGVPFHLEKASDGYWFRNETEVVIGPGSAGSSPGCAFTKFTSTTYSIPSSASLLVHMENQYSPPADVAFEQGAVIEAAVGGAPEMVDPPILTTAPFTPLGFSANLTMLSFVGNSSAVSGTGVVGLTSTVISVNRISMSSGPSPFLFGGFRYAITTAYPQAWNAYFASNPSAFPSSLVSCTSVGASPHSVPCTQPPASGGFDVIRATLNVQAITLTIVVCSVSFT
ncbi:MAG TPA: curlin repeat-containing protein [Thermoplasmata archaeon]|nr:curlin repeat-containing protein [Thermoplasmata archaeon]